MGRKFEESVCGFKTEKSYWEATKYGELIERHDFKVGCTNVTLKIYFYQNEYVQELWNNGIRMYVSLVLD